MLGKAAMRAGEIVMRELPLRSLDIVPTKADPESIELMFMEFVSRERTSESFNPVYMSLVI